MAAETLVKTPRSAVAGMNAMVALATAPLHRFAVPLPVTGEEL
ncbi:hypothetical protein [Rhizorhabdus sp. FW153]